MTSAPAHPEDVFDEFASDYRKAFGENLASIVLYGSGARGDYMRGSSDINFLIVLCDTSIEHLAKALPLVRKWRKRNVATPLFLTRTYIESALDSYPIEFLDLQTIGRTVFGEDVLAELKISTGDLRLQCERELRGKLLHLRQAFLVSSSREGELRLLVGRSLSLFVPVFCGLLYIRGVAPPVGRRDVLRKACGVLGLEQEVFDDLAAWGWEGRKMKVREEWLSLFGRYVGQIEGLVATVDLW